MNAKEFKKALEYVVKEKGIDEDVVIEAMQTALSTAFRKNEKADYTSRVLIDRNTGEQLVSKVEYFPTIIGARVNSFGQKEFTLNVKQINSDELHVVLTDFNVKNYSPLGINKSVGR